LLCISQFEKYTYIRILLSKLRCSLKTKLYTEKQIEACFLRRNTYDSIDPIIISSHIKRVFMKKKFFLRVGVLLALVITLGAVALLCDSCAQPKETPTQVVPIVEDTERESEIVSEKEVDQITLLDTYPEKSLEVTDAQIREYRDVHKGIYYAGHWNDPQEGFKQTRLIEKRFFDTFGIDIIEDSDENSIVWYSKDRNVVLIQFVNYVDASAHHPAFESGRHYLANLEGRILMRLNGNPPQSFEEHAFFEDGYLHVIFDITENEKISHIKKSFDISSLAPDGVQNL